MMSYVTKDSSSNQNMSLVRHEKINHMEELLQGEMHKISTPSFNCECKKGEDAKTWLLGMKKYLRLHNYSSNMEAKIVVYNLQDKDSIWWDQLV